LWGFENRRWIDDKNHSVSRIWITSATEFTAADLSIFITPAE